MGDFKMTFESKNELLCGYAALMLADAEVDVTADNMNAAIKAAGGSVPAYYTALYEKVNSMQPVMEIMKDAGKLGGGGGGGGAAPAAAEAKKESSEEEEMAPAANLFGDD